MTVLLALGAAIGYGLSDFVGGTTSRRTSVWPVGLLACIGALLGSVLIAVSTSGNPVAGDFVWAALAGAGSGVGTAFLYRGLAAGRMGVVAPVSAVGAALLPIAFGLVGGERPAVLSWVGIVLALPGIWLVSRERTGGASAVGLFDGVLAGFGFGLLFTALGQVPQEAGYWPLVGTQAVSVLILAAVALLLGADPSPRHRAELGGLAAGLLATVAVLLFMLATRHGLLSVAAVITSLYPTVTVLLAIGVLKERVQPAQAFGLMLCAATVVCVSAS